MPMTDPKLVRADGPGVDTLRCCGHVTVGRTAVKELTAPVLMTQGATDVEEALWLAVPRPLLPCKNKRQHSVVPLVKAGSNSRQEEEGIAQKRNESMLLTGNPSQSFITAQNARSRKSEVAN